MIQFKPFSIQDSVEMMNDWIASEGQSLPKLDKDFQQIRLDLENLYPQLEDTERKDYFTDVEMGIKLYEYLDGKDWFNLRLASDNSFWRTFTIKIAPHLVAKRWGYDKIDHYYKKPQRNWFKSIWWFVYLSLVPGRMDKTRNILKSKNFTTDTIVALVERTGSDGFNYKLNRKIVDYFSRVSYDGSMSFLFRSVMKLNTARTMVMEPALCEGGIDGYVKALFTDLNAKIIS